MDGQAEAMLERYTHYLEMANYSPRTIQEYRKIVELWFRASGNRSLDVGREELDAWVDRMYRRGLKPTTISTRITALRAFFSWCVQQNALESNPVDTLPKVRLGSRLPRAMTRDEVRRFMMAVADQGGSRGRRDLVLFTLLYVAGLRVSEAVGLRVEDLDPERAIMTIRGKGNRERNVHLRQADVAMLQRWIIGEQRRGWLFPGQGDSHLSARCVQQYCQEYAERAGISRRVTPHTFRHSCAVHSLTGGAPITYVQQKLGHANLATTGIYTQLADEERARITRQTELAI